MIESFPADDGFAVRFLHDLRQSDSHRFGKKVEGLVEAIQLGARVLPGVTLSSRLVAKIATGSYRAAATHIAAAVARLQQTEGDGTLLVRSSSLFEGSSAASFSGLFDTRSNVGSVEEIITAVRAIVDKARCPELKSYFKRKDFDISADHMAVLIQPRITYEYGGVIRFDRDGFLVELSAGDVARAIAGEAPYSSIHVSTRGVTCERILARDSHIDFDEFHRAFRSLESLWSHIQSTHAAVEFLFVRDEIIIVQMTRLAQDSYATPVPSEDSSARYASKTAAMKFFVENGLFGKRCTVLEGDWSLAQVGFAASAILEESPRLTVRLAEGNKIGLPRGFFDSVDAAVAFVRTNAKPSHDVILHGYIDVERSMELLIDADGYLLEHVPGMWESPSKLQPDVVRVTRGRESRYRFLGDRWPLFAENMAAFDALKHPLSSDALDKLSDCGANIWRTLTQAMPDQLPVNVHLVANAEFDEVYALNIRPGFVLGSSFPHFGEARLVRNIADLTDWQPDQVVRLALTTERGNERSLVPIAEKLSSALHPVIVDFGLLSHPAMVLREYGCRLVPTYLVRGCMSPNLYEVSHLEHDFGLDPVRRIISEPAVLSSVHYHLVFDRDPIVPIHYLGLNRAASASLADGGSVDEVSSLYERLSPDGTALFYERGRSPVCTSMFTTPREHFHLLANIDAERVVSRLSVLVGGSHHATLEAAYRHTPALGPYAVFGTAQTGFYVAGCANAPKRLLRIACNP